MHTPNYHHLLGIDRQMGRADRLTYIKPSVYADGKTSAIAAMKRVLLAIQQNKDTTDGARHDKNKKR